MSEDKTFKSFLDSPEWQDMQNELQDYDKQFEEDTDKIWNSLSSDDKLAVFCAVVRRIYKAELVDQGSYRHALYEVFGFGPEAYAPAQLSGYLSLHNAIYNDGVIEDVTTKFSALAAKYNISEEDAKNFLHETFLYY